MPSTAENVDASMRAVPFSERPVPSALLDPLFPERPMSTAAGDMHSAKRSAPSLEEIVSLDLLDSPFSERAARSAKRSVPLKTGTLHTLTADGVVAGEARYAALAKRSAQTADRLLRRVSRHRAKGR